MGYSLYVGRNEKELDRVLELAIAQMPSCAMDVDFLAGYLYEGHASGLKRDYFETCFYVKNVHYEMMTILKRLYEERSDKDLLYHEKYLGLLIYESRTTIPYMINNLVKHAREAGKGVNTTILAKSRKNFSHVLTDVINKLNVDETLDVIRNQVAGHHLSRQKKIDAVLAWHASSSIHWADGGSLYDNSIVILSIYLSGVIAILAHDIGRADDGGFVNELSAYAKYHFTKI